MTFFGVEKKAVYNGRQARHGSYCGELLHQNSVLFTDEAGASVGTSTLNLAPRRVKRLGKRPVAMLTTQKKVTKSNESS